MACNKAPVMDSPFPASAMPTSSGYLPVSESSNSRLFYVFYEAMDPPERNLEHIPLMLWLNGGPGCSSLIGCFYELGPWIVQEDYSLRKNPGAWNRMCGILFIDNPIGAGFSIATSEMEIPTTQEAIASHLYFAIRNFIQQNKNFNKRPLFLAGESYAGKYIPALAHFILDKQAKNGLASQLAGIAIGNGFTHPRVQVQVHAEVAFCFGLLDKQQCRFVKDMAKRVVELVDKGRWLEAHEKRTALCKWIENTSGLATMLDVRRSTKYHRRADGTDYLAEFLNFPTVRSTLNVDPQALSFASCRHSIRILMAEDTMKSTKSMLEAVLNKRIHVLLYQGIYDAKDGSASCEAWMRCLEWQHSERFWRSNREIWTVLGERAGYWRKAKNLTHVINAGAGHQVPADQPLFSQAMIESWIRAVLFAKLKKRDSFSALKLNLSLR